MSAPECASVECIYNDKLHKGFCIGVSRHTNSYGKDVVRMCWVKHKPTPNMRCITEMEVQMTPSEAVSIGVGLIRSSSLGEILLSKQQSTRVKEVKKDESESSNS